VLTIGHLRFAARWFHDDGTINAALFLHPRVGMIPVGAGMFQGKLERVDRARLDARRGHIRHAVLCDRQQQPVPVDGSRFPAQRIAHTHPRHIALAEAQHRARDGAVQRQHRQRLARRRLAFLGHGEIVFDNGGAGRRRDQRNREESSRHERTHSHPNAVQRVKTFHNRDRT